MHRTHNPRYFFHVKNVYIYVLIDALWDMGQFFMEFMRLA